MPRPRLSPLLALCALPVMLGVPGALGVQTAGGAARAGAAFQGEPRGVVAPSRPAVRELWLAPPAGTRVEHFALETDDGATLVGIERLLVGPDPEAIAAGAEGLRLEADTLFFAEGTRVVHTERLRRAPGEPPTQTMVWREIRPRSGRTLLLEGELGAALRSSETVGGDIVRREHPSAPGAFLPLCLLEAARAEEPLPGTQAVFQPLACAFEELALELFVDRSTGVEERVLALSRAGQQAGRYVFRDGALVAFRRQAGGPLARLVSRDDYERLRAEHARGEEPPEEAVVALRPGPEPR